MDMIIKKYSHHFTVTGYNYEVERVLRRFCGTLVSTNVNKRPDGEVIITRDKVYAVHNKHNHVFRFHIEMLDKFMEVIHGNRLDAEIFDVPLYAPQKAVFTINHGYLPRDYQLPLINFITNDSYKNVITLQTGRGKTAVFLFAMAKMCVRTVLVIKPKYIPRWVNDMTDVDGEGMMSLKPGKDILVIRGSDDLRSVINLAKSGELTAKVLVISNVTYFKFLTVYNKEGLTDKYGRQSPDTLWETLKAGLIGVDEGHEFFHSYFKMELYTHAPKIVTLSATIFQDEPFLKKMQGYLYPTRLQMDAGAYIKYANMIFSHYHLDPNKPQMPTAWRNRTDYSQLAYEMGFFRKGNKGRLKALMDMFVEDIENIYMKHRFKDYKLLMLFDTTDMTEYVTKYLQKLYPEFKVGSYMSGEKYEVLKELEIIIATTKSADTGIDIPRLQVALCFVARGSTKSNLQMFGRIREPRDEGVLPVFLWYQCGNIPQHVSYYNYRKELFSGRALSIADKNSGILV